MLPVMCTGRPGLVPSASAFPSPELSGVPVVPASCRPPGDARSARRDGQFCVLSNPGGSTVLPKVLPSSRWPSRRPVPGGWAPSHPVVAPHSTLATGSILGPRTRAVVGGEGKHEVD